VGSPITESLELGIDYEKNNHNFKCKSSLALYKKTLDIYINMAHIKGFHFTQNIFYLTLLDFFPTPA